MKINFKKLATVSFASLIAFSAIQPAPLAAEKSIHSTINTEARLEISFGEPSIVNSLNFKTFSVLSSNNALQSEVEKVGNEVSQIITLESTQVNSKISIPLELNDDFYLELGKDEYGNSDGAALIYNAEGTSVGIINSPVSDNPDLKIVDAEIVDGQTIQLDLESTQNITEDSNLMITASATYYRDYFYQTGQWVWRDNDLIALRLYPNSYLWSGTTNDQIIKSVDSWNKVKAVHSGNSNWYNQSSLEDQYFCHYTFARQEYNWNLEPARPDLGTAKTIYHTCNAPN